MITKGWPIKMEDIPEDIFKAIILESYVNNKIEKEAIKENYDKDPVILELLEMYKNNIIRDKYLEDKVYSKITEEKILEEYNKIGYNVEIFQLNAAEFGVPQSRVRVLFIGLRNDIKYNRDEMEPKGFLFGKDQITIEQAIMDLPQINSGEGLFSSNSKPLICAIVETLKSWLSVLIK